MKKTMFTALALTAALGLSACGDDGADPAAQGSSTSASSTTSSGSAASDLKAGATVDGGELATKMTDAMVKAGSGGYVMELGQQGRANGWFVIEDGKMRQQARMSIQGQPVQMVTIDGIVYLQGIPGSKKPWVKIDLKADDAVSKAFAGMAGDVSDPRQLAKALEGSKATVVSSSADGAVYDVTIDPSKLLGDAGQSAPGSVGPAKARYTLDSQDRPVKIVVEVQDETVTITFTDWGEKTDVVAPPADQVGTFELPTG